MRYALVSEGAYHKFVVAATTYSVLVSMPACRSIFAYNNYNNIFCNLTPVLVSMPT